jgi:undecaprenyl-phosphate galactose phosphotransferase
MTGLWQVNGRSSLTWEEALRFDLFYVENWTLSMDIRVLFRTLRVVIAREGSA